MRHVFLRGLVVDTTKFKPCSPLIKLVVEYAGDAYLFEAVKDIICFFDINNQKRLPFGLLVNTSKLVTIACICDLWMIPDCMHGFLKFM